MTFKGLSATHGIDKCSLSGREEKKKIRQRSAGRVKGREGVSRIRLTAWVSSASGSAASDVPTCDNTFFFPTSSPVCVQLETAGCSRARTGGARCSTCLGWAGRSAAGAEDWGHPGPRRTSPTARSLGGWSSMAEPQIAYLAKVEVHSFSLRFSHNTWQLRHDYKKYMNKYDLTWFTLQLSF